MSVLVKSFGCFIILFGCPTAAGQEQPLKRQIGTETNPNNEGISPGGATEFTIANSPLYVYGEWGVTGSGVDRWRDATLTLSQRVAGTIIDLKKMFPFYGGLYNYTRISTHGNIAFANLNRQGQEFRVGPSETQWPQQTDPAMIGLYLCQQQVFTQKITPRYNEIPNVHYRLVMRQDMTSPDQRRACRGDRRREEPCYLQSSEEGDRFLNKVMFDLQQGIVGAAAFQADAALVVTWKNMMPNTASKYEQHRSATYQLVWATDRAGILSYVILNYDQLGFAANDVQNGAKMGRCRALLNGGNATGTVYVDPTVATKFDPRSLASLSGVPDVVRGRYLFRVDDVVRRGGCSNKTKGTVPLLISPNIANMLGGVSVDVNGKCWMDTASTYNLFVAERGVGPCRRINAAIARCRLPVVQDWGTKEVYFQSGNGEDRAYVGFLYFVPPGIDPTNLGIGAVYEWFDNPVKMQHIISWYPKNFTNPRYSSGTQAFTPSQQNRLDLYRTDLELYVIGYRESTDDQMKKIVPQHKVLARLARFSNRPTLGNRQQEEILRLDSLGTDIWMISERERRDTLHTYRFGYLKLAPPLDVSQSANPVASGTSTTAGVTNLQPGLTSSPIAIHWLWTLDRSMYNNENAVVDKVRRVSEGMCLDWYNEDGNQDNFIRDTETNASCPCKVEQATWDLGRFMPHPRCSKLLRSQYCRLNVGSAGCFISAQNVYGTNAKEKGGGRYMTHYGQVCCYDDGGFLMHTSYQPVIKTAQNVPYNPGFPQRAYEFGTKPYYGQFEVPTLSSMHNDVMPYYLCCKWTKDRCQLFYWRRPSSGCQQYLPPAIGRVIGAGHFISLEGRQFTFNEPGIFTLLHVPESYHHKEVNIQIRLEQYPNRTVDFGRGNIAQQNLVQPTAATVITGIAVEESGKDRVQVVVRKDTRRFKYRTNVVVGGVLRYFDTMWLQRYKGVLIYVNAIKGGQSEVYVVLEQPQIGLRIRESYAEDLQVPKGAPESSGLLDVDVSVSPEYGVVSDFWVQQQQTLNTQPNDVFRSREISGLIRPYPNQPATSTRDEPHTAPDAQFLINEYKVANPGGGLITTATLQRPNLFKVQAPTIVDEDVWPAKALVEEPVYAFASTDFPRGRFTMITDTALDGILRDCQQIAGQAVNFGDYGRNIEPNFGQINYVDGVKCVVGEEEVYSVCGTFQPCRYDYALLYQKHIAEKTEEGYNKFLAGRELAVQHYNSCAAMNIEYPEYLTMQPATDPKYLEGNSIRFDCYQDHWVKGDTEYTCHKRYDKTGRYWVMEWNHGWQPWCRSKAKEITFKWLASIFGTLIILGILGGIFLCCWCTKKRRLQNSPRRSYRTGEANKSIYTHHPPSFSRNYEEKIPVVEAVGTEPRKMVVSLHNSKNPDTKESQLSYGLFSHPSTVTRELNNQPISGRNTLNGQTPVYDSTPSTPNRSHNDSLRGLISAV